MDTSQLKKMKRHRRLYRFTGFTWALVGAVLLWSFVPPIFDPASTISYNGVPTTDMGAKVSAALFCGGFFIAGLGLLLVPGRLLDRLFLWRKSLRSYRNNAAGELIMPRWTIIRASLIGAVFLVSAFGGQAPTQTEDTSILFLIIAFLFGIAGLLFVMGFQRINPWSAKFWRYPAWSINPFQMREPLQFFHFGGYFMLATGAGTLIHQIFVGSAMLINSWLPLVFGIGLLCGVHVCTVVYKNKMVADDPIANSNGG